VTDADVTIVTDRRWQADISFVSDFQ